jgi:hypothetical protein
MEVIRQVLNSNDLASILTLPPSFYNLQVEVIVRPVDNENANSAKGNHSAYGRLNAYANPALILEEESTGEKE